MKLDVNGSRREWQLGLKLWLLTGCAVLLVGCGGGGESVDEKSPPSAAAGLEGSQDGGQARSLSMAAPVMAGVPAGAIRMSQRFSYSMADPLNALVYTEAVVEDVVSKFDARRIPINIVACGTVSGEGGPPYVIVFGMVVDVKAADREAAEAFGFREMGTGQNTFAVFTTGACSYGLPTITVEQRIHGYAERVYPELFSELAEYGTFNQYRYRYYSGKKNYLGLVGDDVYVHNGRDWNFLHVGKVKDFIPFIEGIPGTQPVSAAGR